MELIIIVGWTELLQLNSWTKTMSKLNTWWINFQRWTNVTSTPQNSTKKMHLKIKNTKLQFVGEPKWKWKQKQQLEKTSGLPTKSFLALWLEILFTQAFPPTEPSSLLCLLSKPASSLHGYPQVGRDLLQWPSQCHQQNDAICVAESWVVLKVMDGWVENCGKHIWHVFSTGFFLKMMIGLLGGL